MENNLCEASLVIFPSWTIEILTICLGYYTSYYLMSIFSFLILSGLLEYEILIQPFQIRLVRLKQLMV